MPRTTLLVARAAAGLAILLGLASCSFVQASGQGGPKLEEAAAPPAYVIDEDELARAKEAFGGKPPPRDLGRPAEFRWPLAGRNEITSGFGWREDPLDPGDPSYHTGIDLRCKTGTHVYAARGGRVVFADEFSFYGRAVAIEHGNGYMTVYGHLDGFLVPVWREVRAGEAIGVCGSSGRVTGPHLHLELRIGRSAFDPLAFLPT